jgi:hypothetical protein
MDEHTLRRDIPRQLPPSFYGEAQTLRNKLLQWRFDHFNSVTPDESALLHLEPRLTQIGTPIYSVSTSEQFRQEFVEFLSDYGRAQQTEKPQVVVVEALGGLMADADTKKFTVKEVTEAVNRISLERGGIELTAKAVGGLLRSIGFRPTRTSEGFRLTIQRRGLQVLQGKYAPALSGTESEMVPPTFEPEEQATVN